MQRFVVMDNAASNKRAARLAGNFLKRHWCVCHTLALVVTDLFKASANHTRIKCVLQKCQGVAVLVHRSEHNKEGHMQVHRHSVQVAGLGKQDLLEQC